MEPVLQAYPTVHYFKSMPEAIFLHILETIEEGIGSGIKKPFKFTVIPQDEQNCKFRVWTKEELEPKETFKMLYEILSEVFSPKYYPVIEYMKQEITDLGDIGYGPIHVLTINIPLLLDMKDSYEQRKLTEGAIYGERAVDIEDKILSNLKPFTKA